MIVAAFGCPDLSNTNSSGGAYAWHKLARNLGIRHLHIFHNDIIDILRLPLTSIHSVFRISPLLMSEQPKFGCFRNRL